MIEYLKWLFDMHRKPAACYHSRVRCIHGDEINWFRGKRSVCLDCHMVLDPLPAYCFVTGEPHYVSTLEKLDP